MKKVILIFKKEILDTIRDNRTVFTCIITPFLLYPLIFTVMGYFMQSEITKEARTVYGIGVINRPLMSELYFYLDDTQKFNIIEGKEPISMFKKNKVKAVLETKSTNEISIYYDGADKQSHRVVKRIDSLISEYQDSVLKMLILKEGLPATILKPITVEKKNIAPAKKLGGFLIGVIIPYILFIVAFSSAMHTAIDITAGEKERKTVETLLVADVKRSEIVLGKCCTCFTVALFATIFGLLGFVITTLWGFSIFKQIEKEVVFTIPWLSCIFILIVMFPLLWFFSSVLIAIGSFAKSVKQATAYSSYSLIVVLLLAVFSVLRISSPENSIFIIPVLNTAILQQEILVGEINKIHFLIATISSIIYAMIAYILAKMNFAREEILFQD